MTRAAPGPLQDLLADTGEEVYRGLLQTTLRGMSTTSTGSRGGVAGYRRLMTFTTVGLIETKLDRGTLSPEAIDWLIRSTPRER